MKGERPARGLPRLLLSSLATLYAIPAWVIGAGFAVRALEPFPTRAMYVRADGDGPETLFIRA